MNSIFERHIETPDTEAMKKAASQFGDRAVDAVETLKKALAEHMRDKTRILTEIRGPILQFLPAKQQDHKEILSAAMTRLSEMSAALPEQLRQSYTPNKLAETLQALDQVIQEEYELLAMLRLAAAQIAVNNSSVGQNLLEYISSMAVSALLVESKVMSTRRNLERAQAQGEAND